MGYRIGVRSSLSRNRQKGISQNSFYVLHFFPNVRAVVDLNTSLLCGQILNLGPQVCSERSSAWTIREARHFAECIFAFLLQHMSSCWSQYIEVNDLKCMTFHNFELHDWTSGPSRMRFADDLCHPGCDFLVIFSYDQAIF